MKKINYKKIEYKKVIIFSIIAIFLVAGLIKLKIEPADYKKCLSKEIVKAEELIENVEVGNENGQYSNQVVRRIKKSVYSAKKVVEKENTTVTEEKDTYESLKNDLKNFEDDKNKNCLSKDEVEKIKNSEEKVNKEVELENQTKLSWNMNGKAIGEPTPINLDVSNDSVDKEHILKEFKSNDIETKFFSFRHNGDLPGFMQIDVEEECNYDKAFLYEYDSEDTILQYVCDVAISDGKLLLSINHGGDWVVSKEPLQETEVHIDTEEDDKDKEEEVSDKDKEEEVKDKEKKSEDEKTEDKKKVENEESQDDISEDIESSTDKEKRDNKSIAKNDKNCNNVTSKNEEVKNEEVKQETPKAEQTAPEKQGNFCTIQIRCDTILNNMENLRSGLEGYVPSNGVILGTVEMEIYDGENVFDILKRATRDHKIQMEFRNDPMYSGAYVEGINYLYEFDCGNESGWMYKVNGWFPNYGCSQYKVKNGDSIVWLYTCDLGRDVGDQYYDK